MWRSRLFRQYLLVSCVVALVLVVKNVMLLLQLGAPQPDLGQIRLQMWIFGGAMVALILFAGFIHARLVSDRMARVLRGMDDVRRGEFPRLLVEGSDELAELTRGFNQTVEELRSRDEKLKSIVGQRDTQLVALSRTLEEEHERLETLLDTIGDGVIVLDSENKVLTANHHAGEIFGVPMEALLNADFAKLIAQVRHRLVQPEMVDQKLRDLRRDPSLVDELTLELDEPGGRAIRLYGAPVRGAEGKVLGRIAASLNSSKEREFERLKSEFISTISHELRTPLTSIRGGLGLIRGGAAGAISFEVKELLDIALNNTDRLIRVISDILDVSQFERGQARMRFIPISLSAALARAMHVVGGEAEARNISLESQIPDDLPGVSGDAKRVEQVLVNLLLNGIKFSKPGQKVRVTARSETQAVVVSIQDFGIGMSEEFQSRLFMKFEHAQSALTRESQGAGLGLVICRHIVEAHGGRIWVESEEGRGSTFHFSLPPAGQPAPATSRQPRAPFSGDSRLILVIDDDADLTRVLSYAFQSQGHRVIATQSGREAIELARKHRPDMLTLDLRMPEVDGYTVLATLRSSEETRRVPIVCISMETDEESILSRGADFYLEKPIDIDKLREVTDQVFGKTREY